MDIKWDPTKSKKLKAQRGVSFEEILQTNFLTAKKHATKQKQYVWLFERNDYIWVVPYVVSKNEIFLKTLFPSRKMTRLWKEGKLNE